MACATDPLRMLRDYAIGNSKARQIAREFGWRLFSGPSDTNPLTYPVSTEAAAQCSIYWPNKLQWAPGEAFVQHIKVGLE